MEKTTTTTGNAAAPRPVQPGRSGVVVPVCARESGPGSNPPAPAGNALAGLARPPKQVALRLLDPLSTAAREHPWVTQLLADYQALRPTLMCHLTGEERVTLGRYFAWKHGGCTKRENVNRQKGAHAAKAFAQMATCDQFMDLRASQIMGLCKRFAVTMNNAPWHDPWLIKAVDDGWEPKPIPPRPIPQGVAQ